MISAEAVHRRRIAGVGNWSARSGHCFRIPSMSGSLTRCSASHSFGEAVTRFSRGLRLRAAKAGRPEDYHETITVAFLAVISERTSRRMPKTPVGMNSRINNSDLLDKRCLDRWYDADYLRSDLARKTFCLPTPRVANPTRQGAFPRRPSFLRDA